MDEEKGAMKIEDNHGVGVGSGQIEKYYGMLLLFRLKKITEHAMRTRNC